MCWEAILPETSPAMMKLGLSHLDERQLEMRRQTKGPLLSNETSVILLSHVICVLDVAFAENG